MNEGRKPILVTTRLMLTIYHDFQCISNRCQNNCCHDWSIPFSKKDYLAIKRAPKSPELEELTCRAMRRLPKDVRTTELYGEFDTCSGPCPYQREDGLCSLQLECSEVVLPKVCRQFPRSETMSAIGMLRALSTACEAVVELLWQHPEGLDFWEEPLPKQEQRALQWSIPLGVQPTLLSTTIDILQTRALPLPQRLLALGMALEDIRTTGLENFVQKRWEGKVSALLQESALTTLSVQEQGRTAAMMMNGRTLIRLGIRNLYWKTLGEQCGLQHIQSKQGSLSTTGFLTFPVEHYRSWEKTFCSHFGNIDYFWENLLVNTCFYLQIPDPSSEESLWKSYVNLCNLYSFFRFAAILNCGEVPCREKLFQSVVMVSRSLMHNASRMTAFRDEFFENSSASLAHMAILVQG